MAVSCNDEKRRQVVNEESGVCRQFLEGTVPRRAPGCSKGPIQNGSFSLSSLSDP